MTVSLEVQPTFTRLGEPASGSIADVWHPLSSSQRDLWVAYKLSSASRGDFNLALILRARPAIEPERLRRALAALAARHPMLRARFRELRGEPMQSIYDEPVVPLRVYAVDNLDDGTVAAHASADRTRVIDVTRQPPFEAALYHVGARECVLTLILDHLASDGWSLFLLVDELGVELKEAEAPHTAVQKRAFFEYVAHEQAWLRSSRAQKQRQYWCETLAEANPVLALQTDFPHGQQRQADASRSNLELIVDEELSHALSRLAAEQGTTLFVTLLVAYAILLQRLSDQTHVSIGSAMPTRGDVWKRTVGNLVNRVLIPVDTSPGMTVAELLKATHSRCLRALKNKDYPFGALPRDGAQPAFRASFVFQKARHASDMASIVAQCSTAGTVHWAGYEVESFGEHLTSGGFGSALILQTLDLGDGICTAWGFDAQAFARETIEGYARSWIALLRGMVADPTCEVAELPWPPPWPMDLTGTSGHGRALLQSYNATAAAFDSERCAHGFFERHAERTPEAVAVRYEDTLVTYTELNARANRLAAHLRSLGVVPELRVAVCAERGIDLVVAFLATLKAGGAYVPLDPAYPPERLRYILRDSAPVAVLVDGAGEAVMRALATDRTLVHLEADADRWSQASSANVSTGQLGLTSRHLAYVIYTSGSTGVPKGVLNEHRGLSNLISAQSQQFEVSATSRVLQFASPSFDASVFEFGLAFGSGASLHLAARAALMPGRELLATFTRHGITHVTLPPSALALCDVPDVPFTPSRVIVAGEAISCSEANKWASRVTLWNAYGPTETAVCATVHRCTPGAKAVPLGRPIANGRVYLLDAKRRAVPVGVPGEIYVAGVPVGRGYLNLPERTEESFLADPFVSAGEVSRMYRTGDRGCWRSDGTLEFLGRRDFQVKLRGFRIELGEIEARLSELAGVAEVVAALRDDAAGEKRLVAYYGGAQAPAIDAVRAHAEAVLPAPMVPAAYVRLDKFPLTPNGKVDRNALPAPQQTAYVARDYDAPRGDVERRIAWLWAAVLQRERVGRADNFFELGGNSLSAVAFLERARSHGLHADVASLFAKPVLAEFAATISASGSETQVPENLIPMRPTRITPEMLPLVRLDEAAIDRIVKKIPGGITNVQDIYPLAPLQQGMLYHHLLESDGDPYVLPMLFEFASQTRLMGYLQTISRVIERHDILRTAILWHGLDDAVQVVQRRVELPVASFELAAGSDVLTQLKARFDPRAYRFDVQEAPLLRAHMTFDRVTDRWLLVLVLHHLAGDHTTLQLMFEEVRAIEAGRLSQLAPAVPFRNFIAGLQASDARADHARFFADLLGDVTEPTAPFGLVDTRTFEPLARAELTLSTATTRQLRTASRALGVSVASVVHLAWALVLARASNRLDVVFGTVLSGRAQAGASGDRAFGVFLNTLPVRVRMEDCSVALALQRVQSLLAALLRHEQAPLTLAQQASQVSARVPLFSALLNYRQAQGASDAAAAYAPRLLWDEGLTNYPLSVAVEDSSEAFRLSARAPYAVGGARLCAMLELAITALATAMEDAPSTAVLELQVLPEEERRRWLASCSGTDAYPPKERCIHEWVEAYAELTPGAIALRFGAEELSYRELNYRANRLAHHLRSLGVAPERVVAVYAERGFGLIEAILATWKAGGAPVLLDPEYPSARLESMLRDSTAAVLLKDCAAETTPHAWMEGVRVLDLRRDAAQWLDAPSTNIATRAIGLSARNSAYVVYTSGSTGTPKGVINEHRGLCNLIAAQVALFEVSASSRVLQFASPSFDASISEIGMAFASGASLVLAPRSALLPGEPLLATLARHAITHVTLPPSALAACEAHELPFVAKTVIVAGEAISASEASRWAARVTLWNAYGPTETSVCATAHRCTPGATVVPIGRPIANARVYVLNAQREPVPVGVAGEIYIGGVPVGRGYLNRPDLTQERFVLDHFSSDAQPRMYKTGDLGRFRADGSLEYLGRNDAQVKLRGYRIELGEVEACLSTCEGVAEVAVLVREDVPGDKRLVAYYSGPRVPSIEALRVHARASLPDYMVPAAYVFLPHFPRTPNGKVDRKALPNPSETAYVSAAYVPAQGELEETLVRIWARVLQRERVGRHDNFFDLGGHSLSAVQLVTRLRRELNVTLALREVYAHPTLARFAAAVDQLQADSNVVSNLVPLRTHGTCMLEPLFCVHPLSGTVDYVRRLATSLDPRVPLYGLEACGWGSSESPSHSMLTLAERYIAAIRSVKPSGPYRLLGYSAGGLIAHAMAERLISVYGETVEFLGMIDTRADLGLLPSTIEAVEQSDRLESEHGASRADAEYLYQLLKNETPEHTHADLRARLEGGDLTSVLDVIERHVHGVSSAELADVGTLRRAIRVMRSTQRPLCNYQPSALPIQVTLFTSSGMAAAPDPTGGWGAILSERLQTVPIGGTHVSIMESPHLEALTAALARALG